jgi:hypothetical protein
MRRQHTSPPKLQERGNKYDVDELDALELPRLGIELNFGWGLSCLSPKLPQVKPTIHVPGRNDPFGRIATCLD